MANESHKHIWVFDNPRARSHVFFRWLSTHPLLQACYHPFVLPAHFGPENFYKDVRVSKQRRKVIDELSPQSQTDDSYDAATSVLEAAITDAKTKVGTQCLSILKPRGSLMHRPRASDCSLVTIATE